MHFSKNSVSDTILINEIISGKDKDIEALKEKFKRFQGNVKAHIHNINGDMRNMKGRMLRIKENLVQSLQQNEIQRLSLIAENAELKQQMESNRKIMRKINLRILKKSKKIEKLQHKNRKLHLLHRCQVRIL